jgi:hypothetical protein
MERQPTSLVEIRPVGCGYLEVACDDNCEIFVEVDPYYRVKR